jgi:flagellar motor protein MotB
MAKPRKLALGALRSGEKDESEVRWLISYSDFMMQLVCLFILLYSVSFFDKGRMVRVAGGYRASIGIGDLAALETKTRGDQLAVGDRPLFGGELGGGDVPRDVRFRIDAVPGGWRIAVEVAVFDPGSSVLTPAGGDALDAAARMVRAYAGRSVVTAYGEDATEADPLRLALARAQAAAGRLTRSGVDPRFLVASGQPRPPGDAPGRVTLELRTD